ncbi:oxidoreductase-like domain-containing protein 1 [Pectinophora gossypiella]|uniref:Oxidoreductase-like domain-containing protein n=1 Tax=Pectinophora gossypiella TaxID=13191 RepID=A0A1E1WRT5_PECGO|nr:oxidoreductase-like domain-containing protein 1 [Pectinophora gossypiella]
MIILRFLLRPWLRKQYKQQVRLVTTDSKVTEDEKEKELERIAKDASIDEPPTSCCQSGCSNCVFIVWAEALSAKLQQSPEIAEKVLSMVEDPSMKAYLEMELRFRGLKK